MWKVLGLVSGMFASWSQLGVPIAAQVRDTAQIIVRIYDTFHLERARILAARDTADQIIRTAGVSVRWRLCAVTSGSLSADPRRDGCDDALRPSDLVIRIVKAPSHASRTTLGFAYIDATTKRGWLATVFTDHVLGTAQRTNTDPDVLLGRTIAHELGHLLLNTVSHQQDGFMQARWNDKTLRKSAQKDWSFSARDAAQIRENVVAHAQRSDSRDQSAANRRQGPSVEAPQ
jgi:hypothetical protein